MIPPPQVQLYDGKINYLIRVCLLEWTFEISLYIS